MFGTSARKLLVASGLSAAALMGTTSTVQTQEKALPVISFAAAKNEFMKMIDTEIPRSQADFGVVYSAAEIERIKDHVWNKAQIELGKYYRPLETPLGLEP
jgi:hypothetical protein